MPRPTGHRSTEHEPKPWCDGCHQEFHEHPAKAVANLTDVHRLGRCGLNAIFTPGSRWNYGPVYENMGTIVKVRDVTGGAAESSRTLINYSEQPEDIEAQGKPSWFIKCEVVWTEHDGAYTPGQFVSLPPAALVPHKVVVAEKLCWARAAREASTPLAATRSQTTIEGLERALEAETKRRKTCENECDKLLSRLADRDKTINSLRAEMAEKDRELRCERVARDDAEGEASAAKAKAERAFAKVDEAQRKLRTIRGALG